VFNIFNNFYLPGFTLFQSSGALIGSAGQIGALVTGPRELQFALKLIF